MTGWETVFLILLVTEFSKKTGDYPSLSATDIKVLALTYQLELEHVGSQHLRTQPEIKVSYVTYTYMQLYKERSSIYYPAGKVNYVHFSATVSVFNFR